MKNKTRRGVSAMLSIALASTMISPVLAAENYSNNTNRNFQTDAVYYAEADTKGSLSGYGSLNQKTDTRTQEQIADDNTLDQIAELEAKIDEVTRLINEAQEQNRQQNTDPITGGDETGDGWIPDPSKPSVPQNPDDIDINKGGGSPTLDDTDNLDPGKLPDVTLPSIDLTEPTIPTLPEYNLPNITLPDMTDFEPIWIEKDFEQIIQIPKVDPSKVYPDGAKEFNGVHSFMGDKGLVTVQQKTIPIDMLAGIEEMKIKLHIKYPILPELPDGIEFTWMDIPQGTFPDIGSLPTIPELPHQPTLPFDDIDKWAGDQEGDDHIGHPTVDPDDLVDYPSVDDPNGDFSGEIDIKPLPGTDIDVVVPEDITALYQLLMQYLTQLAQLGHFSANVTCVTQYALNKYEVQTIHKATPTNDYYWVVEGPGGTIERHTTSPNVKILFQSAGTYKVHVYNNQYVTRNNKVSGVKSETWLLDNGSYFDGLVIHQTSSAFEGYISEDIGPTLEKIELKKDGFIANVTESMVGKIQMIDSSGNIMSPADGFTTQRG